MYNLKIALLFFGVLIFQPLLHAQNFTIPLWPAGEIPNHSESDDVEVRDTTEIVRIRSVQDPDIAVFLPSKRSTTGQAVVICPGGGYRILAYDWEGTDIAKMLNAHGIVAVVLKYRLPESSSNIVPHKSPLMDAQRALRMVRYYANDWNVDPQQIGIMGFSAGGHLASTLSTHFDHGNVHSTDPVQQQSCRPDFSILMYPVISSDTTLWHRGSFMNLLGEDPSHALLDYYSNEKQVNSDTPPAILIHSADDQSVPFQNSIRYFEALREKGISAEMHIYPYGGHGYSLALDKKGYLSGWTLRVVEWMSALKDQ